MRNNQKGFVIEGTFAIVALVAAATLAVFTLTPAKHLINVGGDGQRTKQTESYKETIEPFTQDGRPVSVQLPDGSEGLLFKRTKSTASLDETTKPKLSFVQKLVQLGWWWVALSVAGMFFGPLGLVMGAVNGRAKKLALAAAENMKGSYERITGEARSIVLSVDAGLDAIDAEIAAADSAVAASVAAAAATTDPAALAAHNAVATTNRAVSKALTDAKAEFLYALKDKQDRSTKALVSQLREMGHNGKNA